MFEQNDDNNIEKAVRNAPVQTLSTFDIRIGQKQCAEEWILPEFIRGAIYGASRIHMSEPDEHFDGCG